MNSKKLILLATLLLLAMCGCNTGAANKTVGFTADMEATISGITSKAKVMATKNCYRLEIIGGRRASTMIARYDKKLVWLLVPQDKEYKQLPLEALKDDLPEFFRPGTKIEKKMVGEEVVDTVKSIKYQATITSVNDKKFTGYLWEAKALTGFPLKWEDLDSGLVVLWKNAKLDNLPISLFELPQDYTELTSEKALE